MGEPPVIKRVRCPRCNSPYTDVYSTRRDGRQYRRCRDPGCEYTWKTVRELPPVEPTSSQEPQQAPK